MAWIQLKFVSCWYTSWERVFWPSSFSSSSFHSVASLWSYYHLHPTSKKQHGAGDPALRMPWRVAPISLSVLQGTDLMPLLRKKESIYFAGSQWSLLLSPKLKSLYYCSFALLFEHWQLQLAIILWTEIRSDWMAIKTPSYHFLVMRGNGTPSMFRSDLVVQAEFFLTVCSPK